jgi:hypothetical protein
MFREVRNDGSRVREYHRWLRMSLSAIDPGEILTELKGGLIKEVLQKTGIGRRNGVGTGMSGIPKGNVGNGNNLLLFYFYLFFIIIIGDVDNFLGTIEGERTTGRATGSRAERRKRASTFIGFIIRASDEVDEVGLLEHWLGDGIALDEGHCWLIG